MDLWYRVKEEFSRAPVATSCAALGFFIGVIAISIAAMQLDLAAGVAVGTHASSVGPITRTSTHGPSAWSALLVIGIFLATTPAFGFVVRTVYRLNAFVALLLSVVLASLSILLNRMDAAAWGVGAAREGAVALDDLLFYGTMLVFVAVAGGDPLIGLARTIGKPDEGAKASSEDGLSVLTAIALTIAIWGATVAWTQGRLVAAFL